MIAEVDISPPPYKDPATMLRRIADDIDEGNYGQVDTIVVVTFGDAGLRTSGGGKDSGMASCAFALGAAHTKLLRIPSDES